MDSYVEVENTFLLGAGAIVDFCGGLRKSALNGYVIMLT